METYGKRHAELMRPVVRIVAEKAAGSGTVIYSADGADGRSTYILTNHHVVDGLISIEKRWSTLLKRELKDDKFGIPRVDFFRYQWEARSVGATNIDADIMAYDPDEDLALLKVRDTSFDPQVAKIYPRSEEPKLRVTMPVYSVGAALASPPIMTGGFLSQFGQDIALREFWLSTAPIIFGNSGGATFLADSHELIGVPARIAVTQSMFSADAITHVNYIIPITRVWQFLDDQRFRFIEKPGEYTEEGEAKERDRLRKTAEKSMGRSEERGEEEA